MQKCPNCGNEFEKNFCNNCGQKAIEKNISLKLIFLDFIQNVFLFDSRTYKTLVEALIKPGKLAHSYLRGKRAQHLPPFQFFLLYMSVYLLALNFFGESYFDTINTGLELENEKRQLAQEAQNLVEKNLNSLYFVLTPIISFFIYLFYRKLKYNYAEIFIFGLYIMGISFLLSSASIMLGEMHASLYGIKALIVIVYFPLAIMQFTNSFSVGGYIKSLLTILSSYLLFISILLIFVIIYLLGDKL